jgi:hypothetical protein
MEKAKALLLSTSDNPYNPFTNYVDWRNYDQRQGYCCEEFLARMAQTDIDMPESLYQQFSNDAVREIIRLTAEYPDPRLPEGVEYIAIEEP